MILTIYNYKYNVYLKHKKTRLKCESAFEDDRASTEIMRPQTAQSRTVSIVVADIKSHSWHHNRDAMAAGRNIISVKDFYLPVTHKRIALKRILKFTLKQLQHVSVQSPSSGSVLFELAKVTVVKIIN